MGSRSSPDGTNPDGLAFHEAFADLVALFLHFWKSDVLRAQIAAVRGRLEEPSPLGAVALQFGQALGKPDGLRNALGQTVDQGNWQPRRPDPKLYQTTTEPHDRGDILVGAVFEAFRKIYESRVADLRRIASRGTGELPAGNLHPDLVNRFTREAVRAADLVLDMCIRALDYLPPVGASRSATSCGPHHCRPRPQPGGPPPLPGGLHTGLPRVTASARTMSARCPPTPSSGPAPRTATRPRLLESS